MVLLVSLILIGSARSASFEDDHIVTSNVKQLLVIQKEKTVLDFSINTKDVPAYRQRGKTYFGVIETPEDIAMLNIFKIN